MAVGKERSDIRHDKAHAVQDRPGNDDPFEAGTGFIHGTAGFGKVHQKQGNGSRYDGGNRGDAKDLAVDILHDSLGLVPYVCGTDAGGQQTEEIKKRGEAG